jgi:hypothetical protein
MQHRHLNHSGYTLAAVDDIIDRGRRRDWAELRAAALADRNIMERILRVAVPRTGDPFAQRYHFWRQYAEQRLRTS